jgi:hypothetical protein
LPEIWKNLNACFLKQTLIIDFTRFYPLKDLKQGIAFWVKFRQMTIIFLQIGEIFSVV